MKNGFSMIIVNYFSENYIEPLIIELTKELKNINYEFIIVNNSNPNFSFSKTELDNFNIKLVHNGGNLGFGIGMNTGVKYSSYDCFFMINPDMIIKGSTLISIYNQFIEEKNEVGAVSCKILNTDLTSQNSYFMNKSLQKKEFLKHQLSLVLPSVFKKKITTINNKKNEDIEKFEVAGFYASFVLMKKEVFNLINGFDPDFFMYSEDIDLFRTRFPREYKCINYNNYSVIHHAGKTDRFGLMDQQSQISFLLYLVKNGFYFLFIYLLLHTPRYMIIFILAKILNKNKQFKESQGFLKSLKYLPIILRAKNFGSLQTCLKIDEIKD